MQFSFQNHSLPECVLDSIKTINMKISHDQDSYNAASIFAGPYDSNKILGEVCIIPCAMAC